MILRLFLSPDIIFTSFLNSFLKNFINSIFALLYSAGALISNFNDCFCSSQHILLELEFGFIENLDNY